MKCIPPKLLTLLQAFLDLDYHYRTFMLGIPSEEHEDTWTSVNKLEGATL